MNEVTDNETPKTSPSAATDGSVSMTPRTDKIAWTGLIGQAGDGSLIRTEVVRASFSRELELEVSQWRTMATRLAATLQLHAYTGYKSVAEPLASFRKLNDKGQ